MQSQLPFLTSSRRLRRVLVTGAFAMGLLWTGLAQADGSHPGDEPTPVPGDWPEGTAVKFYDPAFNDLVDECYPKPPDPIGPVIQLLAGHWDDEVVDSVAGYDTAACKFIPPDDLCEALAALEPDPIPWTVVVGDWDGDGVDTLMAYDREKCYLRDPGEVDGDETGDPDTDDWRYLPGDWEARGFDSLAVARPQHIGGGAGGLLVAGNFDGAGDTFGVFDSRTGFTALTSTKSLDLETKGEFPIWACFEFEVECWDLYIPGIPHMAELCQVRTCCLGSPCEDDVIWK